MYSNELVIDILNYLDSNINKKISMDELAKTFYFNKDYLMRIFKKELNITIVDYVNKRRIFNSLEQLKRSDDLIIKIALDNGFYSQEYFSEIFTKIIGVGPLTYRKFTRFDSKITQEELDTIRKNLIDINSILVKIDKYKLNIPTTEVKRLSFPK